MPSIYAPAVVKMNTAATNDMEADGFTWAQGGPEIVDKFGKIFTWARQLNGGTKRHVPVVSGDNGATWTQPTLTGFGPTDGNGEYLLIRGASAYDPTHDLLHVVWVLNQADGAVIYRQYSFTRNGGNNVTGVTRVRGFQPETGVGGMFFESPVCRYLADVDKVVIGWSARNGTKAEYRLAMAPIVNGAADVTAATWTSLFNENAGAGATDTLGSAGLVKYSCPAKSATPGDMFLALCRKSATAATHAKDLYWANTTGGNVGSIVWNRATWAAGTSDFRGGLGAAIANDAGVSTLSAIKVAGTDAGYGNKYQLISKLVEDTSHDKLWVSSCVWKDNTAGDTWALWSISGADAVSTRIDVYSGGAANTDVGQDIFVTGDCMYDATTKLVIVSYTDLMRHDAYLAAYNDGALAAGPTVVYSATPVDIPTIYDTRIGGSIAILFRDFNLAARNNPPTYSGGPYTGYFVGVTVPADVGAPTFTPARRGVAAVLYAVGVPGPARRQNLASWGAGVVVPGARRVDVTVVTEAGMQTAAGYLKPVNLTRLAPGVLPPSTYVLVSEA